MMKFDFDKEKFKRVCKKVFVLPIWIIIVSALISTAMLLGIFLNGLQDHPVAYAVYVISAYTLSVAVVACVIHGPGAYNNLKKKVYDNPVGNRYMTDVSFKVTISLYVSLAINTIYSVFKFAVGLYYSSGWWGAIAIYYMVLSLMRFFLLRYIRKGNRNLVEEFKCYRLCGAMMILLNLTLSGIVFQMIWQGKANIYHEIIIIASATYTFIR
ncbi:MAG: hypothetical protein IJB96_07175 [Lachnospira sp.]|nr:hypothetical protein [Lachnospira sp.]